MAPVIRIEGVEEMRNLNATGVRWAAPLTSAALLGCTSFGAVRSAEVRSGPTLMLQVSASTPPGDEAGWFWSFDCATECDHSILNMDLGLTLGRAAESEGDRAYALGVGWSGIVHPYVDGYVQLRSGSRPYGVGARVGIPVTGWNEYQLYGRYDVELENGTRVLVNPSLFYHSGNSPNGANPGRFMAFVQGIGLMYEGERITLTPAASLVFGQGMRESYGAATGSFTTVFAVVSVSAMLHGERK